MLFKPTTKFIDTSQLSIKINGADIELVNQFKFLGVWIDRHLSWEYHLNCLENKIAQYKYLLKSSVGIMSSSTLRTLY